MNHADAGRNLLRKLGYVWLVEDGAWRCKFCLKCCENTNDALEHHKFHHTVRFRVKQGAPFFAYENLQKAEVLSRTASDHTGFAIKDCTYTMADLFDAHPSDHRRPLPDDAGWFVFRIPPQMVSDSKGVRRTYVAVLYLAGNVEKVTDALQN